MDTFETLLPIGTLLLGAGLAALADAAKHRRDRKETRSDALLVELAASCREFLDAAHNAAHLLGRTAPGCPHPLADASAAYWLSESEVARSLRRLELIADDRLRDSARAVLDQLRSFKSTIDARAPYGSPDYLDALRGFQIARADFLAASRRELLPEDHR
ncbi:hypothetical protein [Agromyces sp. CF514]|uniref:hypothetical protein n=1 Tax=Agromyces sp. CF514 TaxID=1881031 RepID=UPI000B8561D3|nr:hypothetical protein [Agromyces sp. CF514]